MRVLCIVLSSLLLATVAKAQVPPQAVAPAPRSDFFCDASFTTTSGTSELQALVVFRLSNELLNFITETRSGTSRYQAPYSIVIECTDTSGVIRQSRQLFDTIRCDKFDQTNSTALNALRSISLALNWSAYTINVEIEQREVTVARWRSRLLRPSPINQLRLMAPPLFAKQVASTSIDFVPGSGGFEFRSENVSAVFSCSDISSSDKWQFSCKRIGMKDEFFSSSSSEFSGNCSIKRHVLIAPGDHDRLTQNCSFALSDAPQGVNAGLIIADLESATLAPGSYQLKLFKSGSKDTLTTDVECRWMNIPLSFRNITYALHLMSYIASEADCDKLSDGSEKECRKKLITWWKKFDPTPNTLYNEAMMAFFRRADEARLNYMNAVEPDGSRTERGKVYILYGSPTSLEVKQQPGGVSKEVWTYQNKVKKKITFETDHNNVFRVVRVDIL